MSKLRLDNKKVIVTGGADGIGKAICKIFADEGAKVIVADINQISIGDAFSHSLLNTLELMLVVTGIISVAVLVLNYVYSRKHTLEA